MQKTTPFFCWIAAIVGFCVISTAAMAQDEEGGRRRRGGDRGERSAEQGDRPERGPRGPGGGRGGPGGMMRMMPIIAALDADGNGEISASEIENAVAALKTLDKNEDGKLTSDEIMPQFGGPRGPGGFGGPQQTPEQMVERFMRSDENKDGKLSSEEMGRFARMLERADTNGDEFVDKEELTAWAKQAASRFGGPRGGRGGPGGEGGRGGRSGRGEDDGGDDDRPRRTRRPE